MGDYYLKDMTSKGIPVTKGLNVTKMLDNRIRDRRVEHTRSADR
jgi:hypothetical protein